MFNRIGIITNVAVRELNSVLPELIQLLLRKGHTLVAPSRCSTLFENFPVKVVSDDDFCLHCDLAIAVGGDGTMLMAAHLLHSDEVPLLGINLGQIGFLADIPAASFTTELEHILCGEYVEDMRCLLEGKVYKRVNTHNHLTHTITALNDLVIQKWEIARMIQLDTYVDKHFVHTQRSDGLIIATPTGSTAYALSGGGPILHPKLEALNLVPICPHTLNNRPIVVYGDSEIKVVIGGEEGDGGQARLSADGELADKLVPGDAVSITKKNRKLKLIHPTHYDSFKILREKMYWGR